LSTRKIFRSEGTASDSIFFPPRSGIICFKRDTFSLGGLYGRFVSVPMTKCAASRCRSAEMTCMELNAGFSGTYFELAQCVPPFSLPSVLPLPQIYFHQPPRIDYTYQNSPQFKQRISNNSKLPRIPQTNRNPLPLPHAPISQPPRNSITPLIQLSITQSLLLSPRDNSRAISIFVDHLREVLRDGEGEEWWLFLPVSLAWVLRGGGEEGPWLDLGKDSALRILFSHSLSYCWKRQILSIGPSCFLLPRDIFPSPANH